MSFFPQTKDRRMYSAVEVKKTAPQPGSGEYFYYCAIGGILSCGLTHTAVTPLDLVKCNTQANPQQFKGTIQGFRAIYSGEVASLGFGTGALGLVKGWGPTLWGYSLQGLFKFGLYEVFKFYYSKPFDEDTVWKYRSLIYMVASASAEFFADIALCPFEAVKVRIQTSPSYARGVMDGLPKLASTEGLSGLYASIGPLWARQIPYTVIKFVAFEGIATSIYDFIERSFGKKKAEMNKTEQMGVVFAAGYAAGIICGAVSHPADTMVSKINKVKTSGSLMDKMKLIYSGTAEMPGIGFAGLWKGFWPRVVMIGTLTGLQWFIYGAFKTAVGLEAPGEAKKK